jgi:pimeloyl-ACP methyl ester carboxylesterase
MACSRTGLPAHLPATTAPQPPMPSTPRRDLEDRTLPLPDGTTLRWALAPVPDGAPTPAPLVLGLHYGWRGEMPPRHGGDFLRVFLEPTFAGTGAVIVAPYCPALSWHDPRSADAVLRLLDHVLQEQPVDPQRVVLAGYSLGGMGTWYLGARHPDRFLAGMAVAAVPVLYGPGRTEGSGLEHFLELSRRRVVPWHAGLMRIPMYVVNSRSDELMPFDLVTAAMTSLRRRGARIELVTLEGVGHYDSREYVEALRPIARRVLASSSSTGPRRS